MRIDLEKLWLNLKSTVMLVTHDISEAILLSDRVIVVSPRPGTIHSEIRIDLPRPRRLHIAESAEFLDYKKRLTKIFMDMGILRE
jgi:NitT/TauT family transport system ATP-binding protein